MELDKLLQQITALPQADQKKLLRFLKHECITRNGSRVPADFQRLVGPGELKCGYLTLKDEENRSFGERITLPARLPLTIVDGDGDPSYGRTHTRTQITVAEWYTAKSITVGTRIRVKYDSDERRQNRPVFHLTVISRPESVE